MEQEQLENILDKIKTAGADSADVLIARKNSAHVSTRFGKTESLEHSEGLDMGLRVFKGRKQAIVSTNDLSDHAVDQAIERAVAMVQHIPEDEYCGLAEPDIYAENWQEKLALLDLEDKNTVPVEKLLEHAARAEETALAVEGVSNSEGASASWGRDHYSYMTSNGFFGAYSSTGGSLSVSVLAGEGTEMERDYAWCTACHFDDLDAPEDLGREAAEKTVKRLNPRKIDTMQVPIVFDPLVSASIVRHLSGAISGASVARGTSFLKNEMGKKIFAEGVTITDDPTMPRGLRSSPFDDEGVASEKMNFVENGELTNWILDLHAARQLNLVTNGRASRGISSPPSPSATNLYMQAGEVSPSDLIGDIKSGLYVTEMMGHGINMVTGDYSRGAFGYWIENGEITYPVSEITIAGNLKDMWMHLTPANDLVHRFGVDAPTFRIDGMTIAGN